MRILFFVLMASSLYAETFQSGAKQVHLIELFSSEGCSSCPPAEKWMTTLKSDPNLWKTFVPVEFHVDYWNHLGWVDPYSKKNFADRQYVYGAVWPIRNVYTPCFVLDGQEWKDRTLSQREIPKEAGDAVGELLLSVSGKKIQLTFSPTGKFADGKATLAIMGNGIVSKVTSGENSNKTLNHEFVVLSLSSEKLTKKGNSWVANFTLPEKPKENIPQRSIAAWVSLPNHVEPLQAVGGAL